MSLATWKDSTVRNAHGWPQLRRHFRSKLPPLEKAFSGHWIAHLCRERHREQALRILTSGQDRQSLWNYSQWIFPLELPFYIALTSSYCLVKVKKGPMKHSHGLLFFLNYIPLLYHFLSGAEPLIWSEFQRKTRSTIKTKTKS